MSIYDVNYADLFRLLLPPDKREPNNLAWAASLMAPLQWAHDNFFTGYLDGSTTAQYNNLTAYVQFDEVRYNNRIYQCIEDSTGNLPTNESYWIEVNADFRGARQRIRYNGQKLVLEYILNKWFGTTFISKLVDDVTKSVVYIENTLSNTNNFFVSEISPNTSFVASYSEIQESFVPEVSNVDAADFKVYYPVSFTANQVIQLKAITEKYKLYGTKASYQPY